MNILHFTIGPVQGFVAQARRTRDLHVGSFLLSYLAGQAMCEIEKSKGKIIFPDVKEDPLLQAIRTHSEGKKTTGPSLGTLPNRFKAEVSCDFNPNDCAKAVQKAWKTIADAVWQQYVKKVAHLGNGVRQIWDRQINHFWEISWVIGEENNLLDRRKNWRSYVPPVEPGDKCTIMGNLQELSGYVRAKEAKEQDRFWQTLRNSLQELDLFEKERLSAVALVKRLFPRLAQEVIGWELPINYPSTANLSSAYWLVELIEEQNDKAKELARFAQQSLPVDFKTNVRHPACITEVLQDNRWAKPLVNLNGECFYENSLLNDNIWPEGTAELRQKMHSKLKELPGKKPSPFYALLLMDGDKLGALLRKMDGKAVSQALGRFAAKVKDIVGKHNGITVYAGGDDVLALLPLDDALKAAVALQNAYKHAFNEEFSASDENKATVSGAIIYAHYNAPLKAVLTEAHKLLDDVAKDKTGRDSLAIAVRKGSGKILTWAAPWEAFIKEDSNLIDELVNLFSDQRQSDFNTSFFYNLKKRFEILTDKEFRFSWQQEVDLITAEYLKNRERKIELNKAKQNIEQLLQICHRSWRENGVLHKSEGPLNIDGALLVRFLAVKGVHE